MSPDESERFVYPHPQASDARRKRIISLLLMMTPVLAFTAIVAFGVQNTRRERRNAALLTAVLTNDLPTARRLLQSGESPNLRSASGVPLLIHAVSNQNVSREMVELLLEYGASVEARGLNGNTPLIVAAWRDRPEIVELLIQKGADVNAANDDGMTGIMGAGSNPATKGQTVLLLIRAGANVQARNRRGVTALHRACNYGYYDAVYMLVKHGADVNARNEEGWTPLMLAIGGRRGDEAIARFLISHGADPKAQSNDGWTPLMRAVHFGYRDLVKQILECGADPNAVTDRGWTALRSAKQFQRTEIIQLLQSYGASR
jgi:cytohesin